MTVFISLPETMASVRLEELRGELLSCAKKMGRTKDIPAKRMSKIKREWALAMSAQIRQSLPNLVEVMERLKGAEIDEHNFVIRPFLGDKEWRGQLSAGVVIAFDGSGEIPDAVQDMKGVICADDGNLEDYIRHYGGGYFPPSFDLRTKITLSARWKDSFGEAAVQAVRCCGDRRFFAYFPANDVQPVCERFCDWLEQHVANEGAFPGPNFGG